MSDFQISIGNAQGVIITADSQKRNIAQQSLKRVCAYLIEYNSSLFANLEAALADKNYVIFSKLLPALRNALPIAYTQDLDCLRDYVAAQIKL